MNTIISKQMALQSVTLLAAAALLAGVFPVNYAGAQVSASLTITAPAADGAVLTPASYEFTAEFMDDDEIEDELAWAIRAGDCEVTSTTMAGNVDGFEDSFTFDGTDFSATIDMSGWALGNYCLAVNPLEQDGEENVRETRTFVLEAEPVATFHFTKIICEDESLLPNGGYSVIDETTAQNFLDSLADEDASSCRLATAGEFSFQYAIGEVATEYAPDNEGVLDAPWEVPVTTDSNGVASVTLTASQLGGATTVSVREVMSTEDYIPFVGKDAVSDVSAEIYCHSDAGNFDNLDWISGVETGNEYHCVAWNVPVEVEEEPVFMIKACKFIGESPQAGWGMMLTNGVDTINATTTETGCVEIEFDPSIEATWNVTEEPRPGYKQAEVVAKGPLFSVASNTDDQVAYPQMC